MSWADSFVDAFNRRDLDALASLVATDAVARVDGAPFPEEQGRAAIRNTSLAYMAGEELGLTARTANLPDTPVLLLDDQGRLDMAVEVRERDGLATSLVYYTMPNRPERVRAVAAAVGLAAAEQE